MSEDANVISPACKVVRSTIQTAVAGVGGYVGGELVRLLLGHPRLLEAPPLLIGREGEADAVPLEQLQPQLTGGRASRLPEVSPFSWDLVANAGTELVFLALPHDASRILAAQYLERGIRVIDLSGAWRLHDPSNAAVYELYDADVEVAARLQAEAVYGCPELHRTRIAQARLVANPGCYATSIILALAPLIKAGVVDLTRGIVCDAKSGVSGAGKSPTAKSHFMSVANNLSAYSVFGHRHTGELLEQLFLTGDQIRFTPHLLPIQRGIFSTIYLDLAERTESEVLESLLRSFYSLSPMVRIRRTPSLPQIQHVVRTSYCDIGFELAPDGRRLVLVSCLDNLLKGAASQAVQNMNLICGWNEEEGLL